MNNLTKEKLEELYQNMSLDEMAKHLGVARSTLYYYMRKFGIQRRSKRDAQIRHIKNGPHQRTGKSHSDDSKNKISDGTRKFWESEEGAVQKIELGNRRRQEWNSKSSNQKSSLLKRLQTAHRPNPGELSKFGKKLAQFLAEREKVVSGVKLIENHISDIILQDRKVVIEMLLPVSVYGQDQQEKLQYRYDKFTQELNDLGYRVCIIEDKSNSISNARCRRIYEELCKFFQDSSLQKITIVS